MKKLLVCFAVLLFAGCITEGPNCHLGLMIHNRTAKTIWMGYNYSYPDTLTWTYAKGSSGNKYEGYSSHKHTCLNSGKPCCWESQFLSFNKYGVDTLMFFVYDEEVILNNNWEDIAKDYMVRQRYDLSLEDMRALNWTLSYPPDERMKDIKMWPPYGTN